MTRDNWHIYLISWSN